MDSRKIKIILGFIGIFLISFGVSYSAVRTNFWGFRTQKSSSLVSPIANTSNSPAKKNADERLVFDESLPRTEECPLNGALYSTQQRKWWDSHRPLGVMIENHKEARPQSGLSFADVVYEAVAEGGITRFLAVFYCQDAGVIGPVRSARTYFLDFISEYGDYPLYAHVGGANQPGPADALSQITDYGWAGYNDLNQFSIGFPVFWRDYERIGHPVATEHTMYSTTEKLWNFARNKRGLSEVDKNGKRWDEGFIPYNFKDDLPLASRPQSSNISFTFWKGYKDYSVKWVYDRSTNSYLRWNGGEKHLDLGTKEQLSAKNIVILFMTERNANDGYPDNAHLLYGTIGKGNALIFQDGKEIRGTWSKQKRTGRTIIRDNRGEEVRFTRGTIWFEIVPTGTEISVE
jgi:hypothetical protein